jgi:6-pyruvoyltetrahydropterin/6-carboxytetrahydropterin synthase
MFRISREIDFCYGHRLMNYPGKCRHLHGHNGKATVIFASEQLDDRGMVLDFSEIKRAISVWVDEHIDHRMLLRQDDPAVAALEKLGEPLVLLDVNPTAENIARLIAEYAVDRGFPVVEVSVWETPRCCAAFTMDESQKKGACPKGGSGVRIQLKEINCQ